MTVKDKEAAEAHKLSGNACFKKRDFDGAVQHYTKAIDQYDKDPSFYTNRAACYLQLKKYKEAVNDSLKATSLNPKLVKGYFRAGQGYLYLGDLGEARRQLQKALDIKVDAQISAELEKIKNIEKYIEDGNIEMKNGNHNQAYSLFDNALRLAPGSLTIRLLKYEAMIGMKQFDNVVKEVGLILKTEDSNNAYGYFLRGKAMYYRGSTATAMNHMKKALSLDPDNKKAMEFRKFMKKGEEIKDECNKVFKEGKYQEACDKYDEAIKFDPLNNALNSTLYCNKAAALIKLEKYEDAEEASTTAIELNDKNVKAFLRRGTSHMKQEKYEDAVRDFHNASELDPNDSSIRSNLKNAQQMEKKAKKKDYYKILGIEKNADLDQIKKAYKKAALKWHPDRFPDEKEKKKADIKFKEIGEAYGVLSDAQKRNRYDNGFDLDGDGAGVDVNDVFQMFFGGGGRGGGGFPFGGGGFSGGGFGGGGFPGGNVRFSSSRGGGDFFH